MIIIAIQLFWLSLIAIGGAAVLFMVQLGKRRLGGEPWLDFLRLAHPLVALLVFFGCGIALFVPIMLFGYLFAWPVGVLVVYYLLLLGPSLILCGLHAKSFWRYLRRRSQLRGLDIKLLAAAATVVLLLDFGLALKAGAFITMDSDSIFHMAKIQYYLRNHLTFTDPYTAYNGVVDWRYSTNVLNGLQAMLGYVLRQDSPTVWRYSAAFYRFMVWISLFALTWTFVPGRHRRQLPYLVLIISPLLYSGYFFTNILIPHVTAVIFIALLFIGLKLLFERSVPYVLILSSLLIATCNALVAAEALCFLGLLATILLFTRRLGRQQTGALVASIAILSLPVLFSARQPSRFDGILQLGTSLTNVHGLAIRTTEIGPWRVPFITLRFIRASTGIVDWSLFGMAVLLSLYILMVRRARRFLKIMTFYVISFAALMVYNPIYTSIIGSLWLIKENRSCQVRVSIVLAMVFYALFALDPLVLTLTKGHLMPWVFARFQDFNVLAFISPLLGVYTLFELLAVRWKMPRHASAASLLVIMFIVAQFPANRLPINLQHYVSTALQTGVNNAAMYKRIGDIKQYDAYIPDGSVVFSNDPVFLEFAPLTAPGSISMLAAPIQSAPTLNYRLRSRCQKQIFTHLKAADLQAAKVDMLVLAPGNETGLGFSQDVITSQRPQDEPYQKAATLPYLRFEKQIGADRVYRVVRNPALATAPSVCHIPGGQ